MAQENVAVVGLGMMTAVGLSAPETAASVRAATMRFAASDWLDQHAEPFTIAAVTEDGLPDLEDAVLKEKDVGSREVRLLQLGAMPLLECLKPVASKKRPVGLLLALPDTDTGLPANRALVLKRLALQTGGAFDLAKSDCGFKGRAGGLLAIGQACKRIRQNPAELVLAGGIDTYRSVLLLDPLDAAGRVKSSHNLDGFVPGEGAGFALLASRAAAKAAGLPILAEVSGVAQGLEEGHFHSDKPYRGEGLAGTLAKFLQENKVPAPVAEVYGSMNGENYWAKEWGVAYLRNRSAFLPEHRMHHPADCFGDTGSACGPLLVGLAVLGLTHKYRQSPCLVYASSDHGDRALLVVTSAEER